MTDDLIFFSLLSLSLAKLQLRVMESQEIYSMNNLNILENVYLNWVHVHIGTGKGRENEKRKIIQGY